MDYVCGLPLTVILQTIVGRMRVFQQYIWLFPLNCVFQQGSLIATLKVCVRVLTPTLLYVNKNACEKLRLQYDDSDYFTNS